MENGDAWMINLRNGDAAAFDHVYNTFYTRLTFFACRIIKNEADAQDIVTETMLKLHERRSSFNTFQNLQAFLYISVRNSCLNYIKKLQKRSKDYLQYSYYDQIRRLLEENDNYVSAQLIKAEVLEEIYHEVERLPRQCGIIFKMGFIEGLKNEEIAEAMGLSYNTVKAQKVRALKLLRLALFRRNMPLVFYVYTVLNELIKKYFNFF